MSPLPMLFDASGLIESELSRSVLRNESACVSSATAGVKVSGTSGVEVSPLKSYSGEGLEGVEVGAEDPGLVKGEGEA
eukprot:2853845-Rhodomonas_salina.2